MSRCPICENRPGTVSTMHADGCPNEACRAFLLGNFDRSIPVEICAVCKWKDGYHSPACTLRNPPDAPIGRVQSADRDEE